MRGLWWGRLPGAQTRPAAGERGVARLDRGRRADPVGDRVEGLEAVAGVEHDRLGVGVELPGLDQLLQRRDGDPAGGLGEDALGAGEQLDAVADLLVGDVLDRAAGAAADVEDVGAVGRVADRQRLGDGVGLDRADDVVAGLEGRRTPASSPSAWAPKILYGDVLDQPERTQLGEALVDLGELRARTRPGSRPAAGSRQPSCSATS